MKLTRAQKVSQISQRYRIPVAVISAKRSLAVVERRICALQDSGLLWLLQGGVGQNLLREEDFATIVDTTGDRVNRLLGVLGVFVVEAEQAREIVVEAVGRRNLNDVFLRNCSEAAKVFSAAGLEAEAKEEARVAFLAVFDKRVKGLTVLKAINTMINVARTNDCLESIIGAFTGLKRSLLEANREAPDMASRIICFSEEELYSRCEALARLYVFSEGRECYITRTIEAQRKFCVGFLPARLRRTADALVRRYGFTQEVFNANPHILANALSKVTPGYAAVAFLNAARLAAYRGDLERAQYLIGRAQEFIREGARRDIVAGVRSFAGALALFLEARGLEDCGRPFEEVRDTLRQAYDFCLSGEREGTTSKEGVSCQPIAEYIKDMLAELYYAHYKSEEERLSREVERLAAARGELASPLDSARLLLEEHAVAARAIKYGMRARLLYNLRLGLTNRGLFSTFVLAYLERGERVPIPQAVSADLNQLGSQIIEKLVEVGEVQREALGRVVLSNVGTMAIASNILISLQEGEEVIVYRLKFAITRHLAFLAAQQVRNEYAEAEMDQLQSLASHNGLPFLREHRSVIRALHLVARALGHVVEHVERGHGASGEFWENFYLSAASSVPEDVSALCQRYGVPPLMVSSKNGDRDVARLERKFSKLEELDLLWLAQRGVGRDWLRERNFAHFETVVGKADSCVKRTQEALSAFGASVDQQRDMVALMIIRSNIRESFAVNFLLLARIYKAAALSGSKDEKAREHVLSSIRTGRTMRAVCYGLLKIMGMRVRLVAEDFGGTKGEAIWFNWREPKKVSSLIFIGEERLSDHMDMLERIELEVAGASYYPFRSPEARLCVCVGNEVAELLARAEVLIGQYQLTQEVFGANASILDGWNAVERVTPVYAAFAFMRTAGALLIEDKYDAALAHAQKAASLVEEEEEHNYVTAVRDYESALSLFVQAKRMQEGGAALSEVEGILRQAHTACFTRRSNIASGRGALSSAREPLLELVEAMWSEVGEGEELVVRRLPVGGKRKTPRDPLVPIMQMVASGDYVGARGGLAKMTARLPHYRTFISFLDRVVEGNTAFAEERYEEAAQCFFNAAKIAGSGTYLDYVPRETRMALAGAAKIRQSIARGCMFFSAGNFVAAADMFRPAVVNNGLSLLKSTLFEFDEQGNSGPRNREILEKVQDGLVSALGL